MESRKLGVVGLATRGRERAGGTAYFEARSGGSGCDKMMKEMWQKCRIKKERKKKEKERKREREATTKKATTKESLLWK